MHVVITYEQTYCMGVYGQMLVIRDHGYRVEGKLFCMNEIQRELEGFF